MTRSDRSQRRRLDPDTRRAAILEAAAQAFGSQPYEHVSVAELAEAADASEALVYRYFGSKAHLYVEAVRAAMAELAERQQQASGALPSAADARDRVRAQLDAYLDALSAPEQVWASGFLLPGDDPVEAVAARSEIRAEAVAELRGCLDGESAEDYLLYGYLGFLDAVCGRWVSRGCPAAERPTLTSAALDSLFGGLAAIRSAARVDTHRHGKFGNRR